MTDYTKTTDFASKDSLTSGDPDKIVKGTEIGAEFDAIAVAVATKANTAAPIFTGAVTMPTLITTASATLQGTANFGSCTISDLGTVTTADINGGTIDGTTIGGNSASPGTFTTLTASNATINAGSINNTTIGLTTDVAGKFSVMTAAIATIQAGTIDATNVGATTPGTGAFTTLDATGNFTTNGISDLSGEVSASIHITGTGEVSISDAGGNNTEVGLPLHVIGAIGISEGSDPDLYLRKTDNTSLAGLALGRVVAYGQPSTGGLADGGIMAFESDETWTSTNQGTRWTLELNATGTNALNDTLRVSWEDNTTAGFVFGDHGTNPPLYDTGYASFTVTGSTGGKVILTDVATAENSSISYNGTSGVVIENATNDTGAADDIHMKITGSTGRVHGVVRGTAITGDNGVLEAVTTLPGTPDADTIYFVV